MMSSSLLHIVACLLALALMLTCCNALPRLCDELSAGGYTYDLSSLGTITSNTLFSIEGYFEASINFCGTADFCGEGVSACLFSATGPTLPLCVGDPTGSFLDSDSPQLGATFLCSYTTIMPPRTVTLRGFVGCGPPEANMAALETRNPTGTVTSYNFIVPAEVYCDGSGSSS